MPVKPSSLPGWVPPSGEIVEPSGAKKAIGFDRLGEKPPRQYFNWFWNLMSLWLVWLDNPAYDDLPEMIGDTVAGDVAFVANATATKAYQSVWDYAHIDPAETGAVISLACTGEVVLASAVATSTTFNKLFCHEARTGVVRWSVTVGTGTGTGIGVVCTDGTRAFVVEDLTDIKVYNIEDGSLAGTMALGGDAIRAMACDGQQLYVATDGASSGAVTAYDATTLSTSAVWTQGTNLGGPDNSINNICTDGQHVFIAKEGTAVGTYMILRTDTGAAVSALDLDTKEAVAIATDGALVYVATNDGAGGGKVYAVSKDLADTTLVELGTGDTRIAGLAVDSGHLVRAMEEHATDTARWFAGPKMSGIGAYSRLSLSTGNTDPARCVACDTAHAFVGGFIEDADNSTLHALQLPHRPMTYRRVANDDNYRSLAGLLVEPQG